MNPTERSTPISTRRNFRAGVRPALPANVLERVRSRDSEALGSLFDAYFDQVYGLAFRLVGDHAAAEDITQEVFLKVHRAADRIDPGRDPAPWLMTITYNACRDTWRSPAGRIARRSSSIEGSDRLGDALVPDRNDPEKRLLAKERERLVQEALMRLAEPMRLAVILHDYEGLSHDEIATATGASHAAIRKRYSRGLAVLGRLLRKALE